MKIKPVEVAINILSKRITRCLCTIKQPYKQYSPHNVLEQINQQNQPSFYSERNFIDRVRIEVQGGIGGNSCISYYVDKRVRNGKPDGGDGGKGGDVYLLSTDKIIDLHGFKSKKIKGNHGKWGQKNSKNGVNGKDIYKKVPVGTLVYEIKDATAKPTSYDPKIMKFIGDMKYDQQKLMICKGGRGGYGNKTNKNNRNIQNGEEGQIKHLFLELKCIADIGLIGYPNAGKTTLLAALTRALPKIANYPFTTLNPNFGYAKFIDGFKFSIADIPGIIEDAHKNRGLGLEFLRHVQRTKVLLYVVDIGQPDFIRQFQVLRNELKQYDPQLLQKQQYVVLNKVDTVCRTIVHVFINIVSSIFQEPDAEYKYKQFIETTGIESFMISAKIGYGLDKVILTGRQRVQKQAELDQLAQKEDEIQQQKDKESKLKQKYLDLFAQK